MSPALYPVMRCTGSTLHQNNPSAGDNSDGSVRDRTSRGYRSNDWFVRGTPLRAPEVEVLLATYNGELYLEEQINSILSQDYPNVRLYASDDGSSDRTVAILSEYDARFPDQIRVLTDEKATGHPKRNFLRLMKASTANYLCFSDQDDVWLPEKISLTMKAMQGLEDHYGRSTPALVFTDLQVVNERLETVSPSYWKRAGIKAENIHSLPRLLSENVITGCTMMINRSLCDLAVRMAEEAEMHDWWIALLAATFGVAEIVSRATILYRQHDSNVIGSPEQDLDLGSLANRTVSDKNRQRQRLKCEKQAEALLRVHGKEMTAEKRQILEAFLVSGRSESAYIRVKTMIQYGFFRHGFLKNIATAIQLFRSRSIADHS
jgi:hypothetical protein